MKIIRKRIHIITFQISKSVEKIFTEKNEKKGLRGWIYSVESWFEKCFMKNKLRVKEKLTCFVC